MLGDCAELTSDGHADRHSDWLMSPALITAIVALAVGVLNYVIQARVLDQQRRQLAAAREGQSIGRFSVAVEQLGHVEAAVRIGAVFVLEQIANTGDRDSAALERDRRAIVEILTFYIQTHAPWPPAPNGVQPGEHTPLSDLPPLRAWAPDVQAAMTVLGRRHTRADDALHLANVDLRRAELGGAGMNFQNADFGRSCLQRAILHDANLAGARLNRCRFEGADLRDARLDNSVLKRAEFNAADLGGAHLTNADLRDAKIAGAILPAGPLLEGARYTDKTTWPAGFDPRSAELRLVWSKTADP